MSARRLGTQARGIAVLVALAALAAGCSIPTQSGPSPIAASHVPYGLLNPEAPTTTTTQPRPSSLVPVKVFFLSTNSQLVGVQRFVETPASLASVINSMLAGPIHSESTAGISTAIPENVTLLSASTAPSNDTNVIVNFNSAFSQISGTSAEEAVSQVVATIAAQNGLGTGVTFEIDGQRTSVPIASGALVPGPVYLLQFA